MSGTRQLRVLDLFSGIGGFSLGLERAGMRTVAFCESDPYCRAVLRKHWPSVPIHDDARTFAGVECDLICGGYPCQPFSKAGKRRGTEDDRHLWPEFARLVRHLRPAWVIAENVVGHISMGLDEVLSDLEALDYSCRPFDIPACALGADHERRRIWVVAHSNGKGFQERFLQSGVSGEAGRSQDWEDSALDVTWPPEPSLVRVVHGVPAELDFIGRVRNELIDRKKTVAEIKATIRCILLYMWEHQDLAATSPKLYRRGLCDCVPEMSHGDTQSGWLLGPRIKDDQGLCDLWSSVCTQPQQETQDLQRKLLERIGKKKRPQAMGSRADRIRALGNAVVPQIPEIIGRAILEAEEIAPH